MHAYTIRRPACAGLFAVLLGLGALPAWASAAAPADVAARELLQLAADGDIPALQAAMPTLAAPWQGLAQARLAAARLDETQAIAQAEQFLKIAGTGCEAALAQAVIADAAFAAGRYQRAAEAGNARLALLRDCGGDADEIEGAGTLASLAGQLADAPSQRVVASTPGQTAFARDKVGLPRATATINGQPQDAVLDTGANLSVVSASTAARLGLRDLGKARVGSSSRTSVATRVAIADHVTLGGFALEHVVFLVLDDAQLDMPVPGGYRIDAIIGLPVFRAIGRVRFGKDGVLGLGGGEATDAVTSNLSLVGSDLYVEATVGGIAVPLHLDSGGSASSLSARFAAAHPDIVAGLPQSRQRLAGAGGATERDIAEWHDVEVLVGGRRHVLSALSVTVRDSADVRVGNQGVLGGDVLNAFDSWTLDFRGMRLELGAALPVAAAVATSR